MTDVQQLLDELTLTGAFVFHGSSLEHATLSPKQPHTFTNGERVLDGTAAICASDDPRYAVLMAICSERLMCTAGWYEADEGSYGLVMSVDHPRLSSLGTLAGYVHVCRREGFAEHGGTEWRSVHAVHPAQIIRVSERDLPHPLLENTVCMTPLSVPELHVLLGDPHLYMHRRWGHAYIEPDWPS